MYKDINYWLRVIWFKVLGCFISLLLMGLIGYYKSVDVQSWVKCLISVGLMFLVLGLVGCFISVDVKFLLSGNYISQIIPPYTHSLRILINTGSNNNILGISPIGLTMALAITLVCLTIYKESIMGIFSSIGQFITQTAEAGARTATLVNNSVAALDKAVDDVKVSQQIAFAEKRAKLGLSADDLKLIIKENNEILSLVNVRTMDKALEDNN